MSDQENHKLVVGLWQCPEDWHTHRGSKELWEELGRTVGAFSTLENIFPTALCSITGHSTMKAALEDPNSVLKAEFAGLMAEIAALRRSRNRLCHGAWIAFETPVLATVRFFPNGEELDKTHQKITSLKDLATTKNQEPYHGCHRRAQNKGGRNSDPRSDRFTMGGNWPNGRDLRHA